MYLSTISSVVLFVEPLSPEATHIFLFLFFNKLFVLIISYALVKYSGEPHDTEIIFGIILLSFTIIPSNIIVNASINNVLFGKINKIIIDWQHDPIILTSIVFSKVELKSSISSC